MILAGVVAEEVVGAAAGPVLLAHVVSQQASSFTDAAATAAINTTGANFLAIAVATYDNTIGGSSALPLVWDSIGSAPPSPTTCTGTASVSGTSMTLTASSFPASAASNGWVGKWIAIQGFNITSNPNACGYFLCTASSTTSITVTTAAPAVNGASATYTKVVPSANAWKRPPNADVANHLYACTVFYCENPTVGSGHQFQMVSTPLSSDGGSLAAAAFSGVATSGSYLQTLNSTNIGGGVKTVQAGSITPAQANNLLLSWSTGGNPTGAFSVDSGFTTIDVFGSATLYSPISLAYLVPSSTAAVNPKWTVVTNSTNISAGNLEFKHL